MAYVCISGNEQNTRSLEQRVISVLSAHPRVLCELRLDFLELNPAQCFSFLAKIPTDYAPRLVLTQRLKVSGEIARGRCAWDIGTWQSWWSDVMALRPWFAVDLDWIILDRLAGESLRWRWPLRARRVIFSFHGTLEEIRENLPGLRAEAIEQKAGIKLAAPVSSVREMNQLLEFRESLSSLELFKVVVPMGEAGRIWRWSPLSGDMTYFSSAKGNETAPGQDHFENVLPYLKTKERPSLYALLGDNPNNRYGEERWNRAFLTREKNIRYVNFPMQDEPSALWAENVLHLLSKSNVLGASVTKPFKLTFPSPTNTLRKDKENWQRLNTDGLAVVEILEDRRILPGEKILVLGSGGAALAVSETLQEKGYQAIVVGRDENGNLRLPETTCSVLVSTWPVEFQENALAVFGERSWQLIIDSHFGAEESPLQKWAKARNIDYLPGTYWWSLQARVQDYFWFGEDRLGAAEKKILEKVPTSKSMMIRALALTAACGLRTKIIDPVENEDVRFFSEALEKLGVRIFKNESFWEVDASSGLQAKNPVYMGEGATGARLLMALSTLMKGDELVVDVDESLRKRPFHMVFESLGIEIKNEWPVRIPIGLKLPLEVETTTTSQFASGILIAAAGKVYRKEIEQYRLDLLGEKNSWPYLQMTAEMIRGIGLSVIESDHQIEIIRNEDKKNKEVNFEIEKDASSLVFLQIILERLKIKTFSFSKNSIQGDQKFTVFLRQLIEGVSEFDLANYPDLAPGLWAASAIFRKSILIKNCKQLHWKESDRAKVLVEASRKLGASSENKEDGFFVDFLNWKPKFEATTINVEQDHRIAMAIGVLEFFYPQISPDHRDCVKKSFPGFWDSLEIIKEANP
ncbi:MAG: type I 3-dehydroquinate dehydratase [Oligoflexia bacterium]|nr:type I 3-dehydroquinate dehydratase [Oligoflexia bacterium]